jgi:hypothetical protein
VPSACISGSVQHHAIAQQRSRHGGARQLGGRQDAEVRLVDVEVVILAGEVDQLPALADRSIARPQRHACRGPGRIERSDVLERALLSESESAHRRKPYWATFP